MSTLLVGLVTAGTLFVLGLAGVLARRNTLIMLLSIEVMLNAAGLVFVLAGSRWQQADGQVMFLLILALAAAEVSVGLGLLLQLHRRTGSLDADRASKLKD